MDVSPYYAKIAKGTLAVFVVSVLLALSTFTLNVSVLRVFPKEVAGVFFAVFSFASAGAFLSMGGIPSILPRYKSKDYLEAFLSFASRNAVFSGIIGSITVLIIFHAALEAILFLMLILFFTLRSAAIQADRARSSYAVKVWADGIHSLLLFSAVFVLVSFRSRPIFYAYLALSSALSAIIALRKSGLRVHFTPFLTNQERELWRESRLYFASAVVGRLRSMENGWAAVIVGPVQAAIYAASRTFSSLFGVVLGSTVFLFFPVITDVIRISKEKASNLYRLTTKWIAFVVTPPLAVALYKPDLVLSLLYGGKFNGSGDVLRLLSLGSYFNAVFGANGATVAALNGKKELFIANLLSLLSFFMISLMFKCEGAFGVAIASFLSILLQNTIYTLYLYKSGVRILDWRYFAPLGLSFVFLTLLDGISASLLLKGVIYVFAYFFTILLLFESEDLLLLRKLRDKIFGRRLYE